MMLPVFMKDCDFEGDIEQYLKQFTAPVVAENLVKAESAFQANKSEFEDEFRRSIGDWWTDVEEGNMGDDEGEEDEEESREEEDDEDDSDEEPPMKRAKN